VFYICITWTLVLGSFIDICDETLSRSRVSCTLYIVDMSRNTESRPCSYLSLYLISTNLRLGTLSDMFLLFFLLVPSGNCGAPIYNTQFYARFKVPGAEGNNNWIGCCSCSVELGTYLAALQSKLLQYRS
jgi:hypothetical protein